MHPEGMSGESISFMGRVSSLLPLWLDYLFAIDIRPWTMWHMEHFFALKLFIDNKSLSYIDKVVFPGHATLNPQCAHCCSTQPAFPSPHHACMCIFSISTDEKTLKFRAIRSILFNAYFLEPIHTWRWVGAYGYPRSNVAFFFFVPCNLIGGPIYMTPRWSFFAFEYLEGPPGQPIQHIIHSGVFFATLFWSRYCAFPICFCRWNSWDRYGAIQKWRHRKNHHFHTSLPPLSPWKQ